MTRLFIQAQAEQDLLEIWRYTFNEWGVSQANTYLDELADESMDVVGQLE